MVLLTTATAQLPCDPRHPSVLWQVARLTKLGFPKPHGTQQRNSPPTSEGKVIQRWGSNWSNSMILCIVIVYVCTYITFMYFHVLATYFGHITFQHLFSPKNSTCPITNTSLLLQKEPQRLLRADSLGSFVVFGTDSMGASASLKAAKLCLGKDGGKPNNQAGERQIFFVLYKVLMGALFGCIFF